MKNNQRMMTWFVLVLTAFTFSGCGFDKSQQRKVEAEAQMTTARATEQANRDAAKTAEKAQKAAAKTAEEEVYVKYRIEMEKINLEREKAGLPPSPIATLAEWRKTTNQ